MLQLTPMSTRSRSRWRRAIGLAAAFAVATTTAIGATSPLTPAVAVDTVETGALQGHMALPSGIDATRFQAQIVTAEGGNSFGGSLIEANGDFFSDHLPAGSYRVELREYGIGDPAPELSYQTLFTTAGPATFEVSAGTTTTVNFTFQVPGPTISGTIDVEDYQRLVVTLEEYIDGDWNDRSFNVYDGSGAGPVSYTTPKLTPGTRAVRVYAEDPALPKEWYYIGRTEPWGKPEPIELSAAGLTGVDYMIKRSFAAPNPTVSGTPRLGSTLTANLGTWQPTPASVTYQWLRGTGNMSESIPGATGSSYKPTAADLGAQLQVHVVGSQAKYHDAYKYSELTAAVAAGALTAPTPTITGTAKVGETLTVKPGTWTPAPDKLATQWLRDGTAITGATGTTYQATTADTGKKLSVKVTGTKTGYTTASQTSAATAAVAEADPLNFTATPTPTITGTAKVGQTLTAKPGTWTPAPDKLATQWLRDGTAITGATGTTYQATTADTGKKLSVKVTGTKTGYTTASKTSAATAAVTKADYVPPKTSPFSDMKPNDKFFKEIAWMFDTGVSTGVSQPDGTRAYQPKVNVTREAMAAFLFRIHAEADYRAPAKSQFTDVKPGDKFYKEISWMYDQGISTGVKQPNGTRTYQPKNGVTREAMAAFMYRLDTGSKPSAPSASPFQDITVGQKFYKEIAWMSTSGLSTGITQPSGKPIYAPKSNVTREAMAAFLFRADGR